MLRVRALLWIGFGGLLLLMAAAGLSAISFLYQVEIQQEQFRRDFVERDRVLEKLRSEIYLSGTYVRDFLMDTDEARSQTHRQAFFDTKQQIQSAASEFRRLGVANARGSFAEFERQLNSYLATLTPVLDWSMTERRQLGPQFVREQVLPRRMDVISLAERLQQVSERQLEDSSEQIAQLFASFRRRLALMFLLVLVVGAVLAGVTLWRILDLERKSQSRFEEVLRTRRELQRLFAELISAQEAERKRIARELHDQVGQTIWAMMLGLSSLRSALDKNDPAEAERHLESVHGMAENTAALVRNISLLLRPSMLDDLGLISALHWLVREVSRTSSLQVELAAPDVELALPEDHKTCIYRVVQETLRNVARHAAASRVKITIEQEKNLIRTTIKDDGRGFKPEMEKGVGILGMEERVARLGGKLAIDSRPGRGTTVVCELPLPGELDLSQTRIQESSPLRTA
jgi:signal transduction histidine kinase